MSQTPQTGGVYLDTNILIASIDQTDRHSTDVLKALEVLSRFPDINLYVSDWTIAEMKKVFVNERNYPPSDAKKISNRLKKRSTLRGHPFTIVPVRCKFQDFFESLYDFLTMKRRKGKGINGLGDAIHCTIMKDNKISMILSTDDSSGLDLAPNQILLRPEELAKSF